MKVGIIGASGYTGGELLRLLLMHPRVKVECATSRRFEEKPLASVHSHLSGFTDAVFENLTPREVADRCDLVFTAVPHGAAMKVVPELVEAGVKVIDLSADYRLPRETFEKVYGMVHIAPMEAVFGLCELHPEVASATLCANPGCYPTGAVLAAAPLVAQGVVERVVFDSKSGISGAGAEPTSATHYPNVAQNVVAYRLTTHRHLAEMRMELSRLFEGTKVSFTPHVIPSVRGILTTAHVFVRESLSSEDIRGYYEAFYEDKPFIRLLDTIPTLSAVRGSNFCDIGFEVEKGTDRIVVVSAIDNLVKGASGQAVQNMNLMSGFDEVEGLWNIPVSP
ncbi:N-acetyl-gamma-glutamyl-phosphate reductase [Methermicoccus shengliensis]|uniref:N-acetyl-gamma-glutamyl-phosphate reductase n=1 Tax=Methermicoccus shengliensis TaxID=660064 RepID=A0A832RT06_9EURY|nr:N-acetyl-gamma-glutamyl-phosphate reductase [Methermicoccus shengliensis]KUK04740.1 MAG: N-acetyl-gamma-glutamyl-phosphate reductase [Euryarchaeota archaeon 55_53]KUK29822.1 MAG: N-acetyl-gamma-glutamyl-phosphate reductase [Methanosarcinales archeaon 56_1174]MDI3487400.1 N-acetyl-gamma-glutamyl-phosphate reductase [Methanosarcinales archaeon]MDN5295271.1 N-acetyl-gamma-glutamyl-phosphate reductase [Methanosarcinales archaeon]HIH69640.1 N-acetyl-gamma-glutamyl-phosphate reductase [Methermico